MEHALILLVGANISQSCIRISWSTPIFIERNIKTLFECSLYLFKQRFTGVRYFLSTLNTPIIGSCISETPYADLNTQFKSVNQNGYIPSYRTCWTTVDRCRYHISLSYISLLQINSDNYNEVVIPDSSRN